MTHQMKIWYRPLFHIQSFLQTCKLVHTRTHTRCRFHIDPFSFPIFFTNLWTETSGVSSHKEISKAQSILVAWGWSLKQSSDVGHCCYCLLIQKYTHPFPISPIISPISDTNLDKPQHSIELDDHPEPTPVYYIPILNLQWPNWASHFISLASLMSQNQRGNPTQ